MAADTIPLLTIVATAVVTAGAAQVALLLKDHWLQSREGKFSSLYAALFFEEYAQQCSYYLSDIQDTIAQSHDGLHSVAMPPVPDFPTEIDWRKVGIRLTEDAFAFRVAVASAQSSINYASNIDPPEGGQFEVQVELAAKGLKALDLARRIRYASKLKPAHIQDPEFTTERFLSERRAALNEIEQKRLAAHCASLAKLNATLGAAKPDV